MKITYSQEAGCLWWALAALYLAPAQGAPRVANSAKISTIDLEKMFPTHYFPDYHIAGINRSNDFLVEGGNNKSVGLEVISIRHPQRSMLWPLGSNRAGSSFFSNQGDELIDLNGYATIEVINARTHRPIVQLETGQRRSILDVAPLFHPDWIALSVGEEFWSKEDHAWAGGDVDEVINKQFIEVWNWRTSRRVLKVHRSSTMRYSNEVQLSPDSKRMVVMYLSAWAENPKTPLTPGDDGSSAGQLEVMNPKSGRVAWRFEEKTGKMRRPVFFLSNSQMVVRNLKFDLNRKKATPLFVRGPKESRLDCVGAVPGVLNRAFFLTRNGLELWDVLRQKPLHRWANIRKAGQVTLTPDRTILSARNGWKFDFYSFKPGWLKAA